MPPATCPETLFGCDVDAAKDCGLEGIHWEAAFIADAPPLSRVFQVAHVKPADAKNRLISPSRWIFRFRIPARQTLSRSEEGEFFLRLYGLQKLISDLPPMPSYSLFNIDNLQQRSNVN